MNSLVLRVDGREEAVPPNVAVGVDSVVAAATRTLGPEPLLFAVAHRFGDHVLTTLGASSRTITTRAYGRGSSLEAALGEALAGLVSALDFDGTFPRTERPQVAEVTGQSFRFPSKAPPGTAEALSQIADERFLYHLTDEEARDRAAASGESFYIYAASDTHEFRVLIRLDGAWYRLDDPERAVWTRSGSGFTVSLRTLEGGKRTEHIVGRIVEASDLPAAVAAWQAGGEPCVYAEVASLGRGLLLFRAAEDLVQAVGYEAHVDRVFDETGPFHVPTWATPQLPGPSKAERLAAIFRCPRCQVPQPDLPSNGVVSCSCGGQMHVCDGSFDFVTGGAPVRAADPDASRNTHAKQLIHDLRLYPSGLVLNAGAGDTSLRCDNLVNLEIVRYPNTDVVADGQRLPFVDDAFDMVFSQSVIEHVPDPFSYARELQRVLKPGGTILVDAPFMAPFHGYPDHYFNPTMNGLRRLFAGIEEVGLRAGPHHEPGEALLAFMSHFLLALRTDESREELLAMPVGMFLERLRDGLAPTVTRDLDRAKTYAISAGFAFYGRKAER